MTCSLCVINHNGQKHQEEEDGASNCEMMKGKVPIMSWLIMGTFPFIFIQNQMCFVVVVVVAQLLKLNQFPHDLVAGVATTEIPLKSLQSSSFQVVSAQLCGPHQSSVVSTLASWNKPDMTSQFIRCNLNRTSVNIERNQDTHEEIERSCFPTASLKQGSLSSCQLLPICSLQQLLDKSKCFAFKTWQERNEYLRDYHSSNIHTIALFLSSYVNSHWSIFCDTFIIISSVWENNAIFN